jgi:hypothetical protein
MLLLRSSAAPPPSSSIPRTLAALFSIILLFLFTLLF